MSYFYIDSSPFSKFYPIFRLIEEEAKRSGRAQFSILVDEWGSSGKTRPKISDLINLLHQVELFQAVCSYLYYTSIQIVLLCIFILWIFIRQTSCVNVLGLIIAPVPLKVSLIIALLLLNFY